MPILKDHTHKPSTQASLFYWYHYPICQSLSSNYLTIGENNLPTGDRGEEPEVLELYHKAPSSVTLPGHHPSHPGRRRSPHAWLRT